MRSRVPVVIMAALLLCVPSACKRSFNPANVANMDGLLRTTDSLIAVAGAIDTPAVNAMRASYIAQKDALEAHAHDTLTQVEAVALGNYHRTMSRSIWPGTDDVTAVISELTATRKQLIDLKHDVEQGILDVGLEGGYITQEATAVAALKERTTALTDLAAMMVRDQGRWDAISDSLSYDTASSLHTP